jgi:hypothetical protein
MTFDVEIMLRQNSFVFTERLEHDRDAGAWTERDVETVLKKILQAIDQVMKPEDGQSTRVSLRGLSWIVNPYKEGVVIALEIHSASAVAGPFAISQSRLEHLMARAIGAQSAPSSVH